VNLFQRPRTSTTSAHTVAVWCEFTMDFASGVWCKRDSLKTTVPRMRTSTHSSPKSNECAGSIRLRSSLFLNFQAGSSDCDSPVKFLVRQNSRNLQPPVSVEVSVREIRQIQKPLPVWRPACDQTSFDWPNFNFCFRLCPPVFKSLRVSFSRARSSVTFP